MSDFNPGDRVSGPVMGKGEGTGTVAGDSPSGLVEVDWDSGDKESIAAKFLTRL